MFIPRTLDVVLFLVYTANMQWTYSSLAKIAAMVILLTFALFTMLGLSMNIQMSSGQHGIMMSCPFAPGNSLCPMSLTEHISRWHLLASPILPASAGLLILLFGFFFVAARAERDTSPVTIAKPLGRAHPIGLYRLNWAEASYLRLAFATGVIHPKIY